MSLIEPVSSLSIKRAVNLYTIILLLSFAGLLYWIATDRYQSFTDSHVNTASSTTRLFSYQISKSLIEKQREIDFFVEDHQNKFVSLSAHPNNRTVENQIINRFKKYHPDFIDFSILNTSSQVLYGDINQDKSASCLQDFKRYIKTGKQALHLQPYKDSFHYDIVSKVPSGNHNIYVIFRFTVSEFTDLLSSSQTAEHTLVLVNSEAGRSVGITADGQAKKIIGGLNFKILNGVDLSTIAKAKIKETNWYVVDMADSDLFSNFLIDMVTEYFIAFYIFAMIVLFMRYILLKQDIKRSKAEQQLKKNNEQIKSLNNSLEQLSKSDGLTSMYNRRFFDDMVQHEWNRALRSQQVLICILIDIDYFKKYNDHYGHQAGDKCIKDVARLLKETFRRSDDTVARYGGEEFIIAMSSSSEEEAKVTLIKFQLALKKLKIPHAVSDIEKVVTVSAGLAAQVPAQNSSVERLIRSADEALYKAKEQGRNQFVVYQKQRHENWNSF